MKINKFFGNVFLFFLGSLCLLSTVNATTIAQQTNQDNQDDTSSSKWFGQTFTPSINFELNTIKLKLDRYSGNTGNFIVSLREVNQTTGTPMGVDLCSDARPNSLISSSMTEYTFTFTDCPSFEKDTLYALIGRTTGDRIDIGMYLSGGYAEGQEFNTLNSGFTWTLLERDLYFIIDGTEIPDLTPTIQTDIKDYYNSENISIQLNTSTNTNMSYSLDNGTLTRICNDCNNSILNLNSLSEGSHSILFESVDENGVVNTTQTFTIDTTNPVVINNIEQVYYDYNIQGFNSSCNDENLDTCLIEINNQTTNLNTTNFTFTENGNFSYSIIAQDKAGNQINENGTLLINPKINFSFYSENGTQITNFSFNGIVYDDVAQVNLFDFGYGNHSVLFEKLGYVSTNISFNFNTTTGLNSQFNVSFAKIIINVLDRETGNNITSSYTAEISGPSGTKKSGSGEIIIQDTNFENGDYSIVVSSAGYISEYKSFTYTNQKIIDLDFYLLKNDTSAKDIFVYVQSSFVNSEDGVIVVLEEYNGDTGKFNPVSEAVTSNSRVNFKVELKTKIYRICAYGENVVACLKPDRVFYIENEEFTIDLRENIQTEHANRQNFIVSFTNSSENNNSVFNLNFRDPESKIEKFCLDIFYLEKISFKKLSSNCLEDYQGSIERIVMDEGYIIKAIATAYYGENSYPLGEIEINNKKSFEEETQNSGVVFIIAVVIILCIVALGLYSNPLIIPFGLIGATIFIKLFVFTTLDFGLVLAIIITNIVIAIFLFKNE